jgi:transposase
MTAVLDELELTKLVTSIHGLSAVGRQRSWLRPATRPDSPPPGRWSSTPGLAPREKLSGTFTGRTKLSGQGRPKLRLAAWRAVWGALQTNTVYAARYRHLTTRETNKLTPTQAQTVIAATILRHLHAVITTGRAWDPVIATNGTRRKKETTLAA